MEHLLLGNCAGLGCVTKGDNVGLVNVITKLFLDSREQLTPSPNDRSVSTWLSVGTVDYYIDYEFLQPYGFSNERDHVAHQNLSGTDRHESSKKLCGALATYFGYSEYLELDINARADVRWDLNFPIPEDLKNRFDLVFDCGSVEHVINISQAMKNLKDMTAVGGRIVHTQLIGDQTNGGYWTISPNYYLDFYERNGFKVDKCVLHDLRGAVIDYTEVTRKTSTVGFLLPLRMLPGFYFRMIRGDLVAKALDRYSLPGQLMVWVKRKHPRLARVMDAILGQTLEGRADWGIFVIATKLADVQDESYSIQNVYRRSYALPAVNGGLSAS